MPRRLGDDPLARARGGTARVEAATEAVAPESSGQTASHRSYNDVFFRIRGEERDSVATNTEATEVPEAREISEISEIPEIREVAAAAPTTQLAEINADEVSPAPVPEPVETDSVVSSAPVAEPVASVDAAAEVKEETASPPAASNAPSQSADQPKPEKEGGFFKRLFGKFGK